MQVIDHHRLRMLASEVAAKIQADPALQAMHLRAYAVPRGGIPAAMAISIELNRKIRMVENPEEADIIIDDLIDSGRTMGKFIELGKPFYALIDKRNWGYGDQWVVWPWEQTAESGIEDHITRIIQYIGDDPTREGLTETPSRVSKAWKFWCSGYNKDPAEILKTFQDGAEGVDEMVVVRNLPFYTHCEHHLTPFFGTATIAYLPNGKVVGLSKLDRLLDIFARRLQVQERLTKQIADALMDNLQPLGAGVVIRARHLCMESRGIRKQGHETITSALRGVFKTEPAARSEFLQLAR